MKRAWVFLGVMIATSIACSTNILHGIDERSANEATSALERAGIGAEKIPDEGGAAGAPTFTIRVAHADGSRAVDLLRALGLPRDRRRGLAETYGQPSLIPTPSEERARYLDAIAGEVRWSERSRAPTASSTHACTWCWRRSTRWRRAPSRARRRARRCCSRSAPVARR
jgi:type III secretory pathway lipoprotein EscJ